MGQPSTDRIAEGLAQRAEQQGIVRVIVEVEPSDPAAVEAADATARGLCANLDCARLRVATALDEQNAPVIEELSESQMVLEVTPEGLSALEASPFVRRVVADGLDPVPLDPLREPLPDVVPEARPADERPGDDTERDDAERADAERDDGGLPDFPNGRPPGLDAPH